MGGELSGLVRRRRLELRLTQRQAAERAGVSLATWQSLERRGAGAAQFAELTLARVAHGLGVPRDAFDGAEDAATAQGDVATQRAGGEEGATPPVDALIASLAGRLRELADVSPETFLVVHGQANDAADHFLRVLREG